MVLEELEFQMRLELAAHRAMYRLSPTRRGLLDIDVYPVEVGDGVALKVHAQYGEISPIHAIEALDPKMRTEHLGMPAHEAADLVIDRLLKRIEKELDAPMVQLR